MAVIPTEQDFDAVRGQDLEIIVTVTDADGDAVDLSASTVVFGIAKTARQAYLHTLTTDKTGNVITADLPAAITEQLTQREYYYSCWVVIAGINTPVAIGKINMTDDSRNY